VPGLPDTKSVADPKSWPVHDTVISVKRRPSGRSNKRRTAEWIPPIALRYRDPVNLGDVEGALLPRVPPSRRRSVKNRSSRRGKEEMKSKTSKVVEVILSDLTAGENPKNGARGISKYSGPVKRQRSKEKSTTL